MFAKWETPWDNDISLQLYAMGLLELQEGNFYTHVYEELQLRLRLAPCL